MSAQEILTLAQQGDSRAIATLMNCITRPQGVNVRVQEHQACLHILFESEQVPDPIGAVEFACDSITTLKVAHSQLMIYGRQQGQTQSAWQHWVHLTPVGQTHAEESLDVPPSSSPEQSYQMTKVDTPEGLTNPFAVDEELAIKEELLESLQPETANILKRPEAVVLIIFAGILLFWDAYLSILEEIDDSEIRFSTSRLAARLNTTPTILRHKKRLADFEDWSKSRDPDGIAWSYHKGTYSPVGVPTGMLAGEPKEPTANISAANIPTTDNNSLANIPPTDTSTIASIG
jgi:hypothetical protein